MTISLWKVIFTALKILAGNFGLLCCQYVFSVRVQDRVQFLLNLVAISAERIQFCFLIWGGIFLLGVHVS